MPPAPAPLPGDVATLQALLLNERTTHQKHVAELEWEKLRLEQKLEAALRRLYGPRADRLRTGAELGQMLLGFFEQLEQRPAPADEAAPADSQPRRIRRRPGRRDLARFEALPVREVVHELSQEQRACPGCGVERVAIGNEESWQLEVIPARVERLRHLRVKYACPACEREGAGPAITVAPKPAVPVERGMAGPGLLAYVVSSKFADYLPLYRLENIFTRMGVEIPRSTLSLWCRDVADIAAPIYGLMAARVRTAHVVATDDTPMPMQEPGAGKTRTARMWIYRGDASAPYNVFDFTLSRKRDGPAGFLEGFDQVLVADAYGGYDGVVAGNGITRAGCWAHARRYFVEAEKTAPDVAHAAVALIGKLFAVERQAAASVEGRLQARQEQTVPVLAQLRERLLDWKQQLLPKHAMAQAVGYVLNHWDELNVFTRDGAVPIDNNAAEREMKRIVLNRKNSLFVGNPAGGRTAAILSTLTSTCARHGIDPQVYLTQLLVNLGDWPQRDLAAWLPDVWKLRQAALPRLTA